MIRVSYTELKDLFTDILLKHGFENERAQDCSEIFAENTLVGVSTHGVNRFSSFIELIKSGHIIPNAIPTKIDSFNSIEQWDGNLGPGPLNAKFITKKTIEIAERFGTGCIALRNTNHWLRPGYYAWQAAEQGYILICWTNTIPIMPPWGGKDPTTGNNPIVFGVPRKEGHIVIDMALSQFSYGKLSTYARAGKDLPYIGGYDKDGNLTKNAKDINDTQRTLPIGLWKGSGLSLMLDLIATILSSGKSTFELSNSKIDSGMSQIYIIIDPLNFNSKEVLNNTVNEILRFYRSGELIGEEEISYPGERIVKSKIENLKNGIPIEEKIWNKILNLQRQK